MFSFDNLSDHDFEALCCDVMSKKLGRKLLYFGPGRDHGIDLTDDVVTNNIIVQVKHYAHSTVSSLISTLKKERKKLDKMTTKPKKYYVCCSLSLTKDKQKEIYQIFKPYMHSSKDVIECVKLDNFLQENADIVEKHFKLWMVSSNVLGIMLNRSICIDSEFLISNIQAHKDYYVQTRAYNEALRKLDNRNVLLIVGSPGVGKTITSEMLVLKHLADGYRVRYTTDVTDLKSLKNALAKDESVKELVLLDDCFGQAYFMMKESQTNELVSLIKYVTLNKNKRLIMNSRITIYNKAKKERCFYECENRHEFSFYLLDLDKQPRIDKALILYNHLYFNKVDNEHLQNILKDRNYLKIIDHTNYNPRIIEHVTNEAEVAVIAPEKYSAYILELLNNPDDIWMDEFQDRIKNEDRFLLETLYSLTDTTVEEDLLRKCYNSLIASVSGIDKSLNNFQLSVERLSDSMIRIIDDNGVKKYSVANPSINDFLRKYFLDNENLVDKIIDNAKSVYQLKRLIDESLFDDRIKQLFNDNSILGFEFADQQMPGFITYYCSKFHILDEHYTQYIHSYLSKLSRIDLFSNVPCSPSFVFDGVFSEDFYKFHNLKEIVSNNSFFTASISALDLEEGVKLIEHVYVLLDEEERELYSETIRDELVNKIEWEYDCIDASEYEIDLYNIVDNNKFYLENGEVDYSRYGIEEDIKSDAISAHVEWIKDIVSGLPEECLIKESVIDEISFSVDGVDSMIDSYFIDDYDDDDYDCDSINETKEIDNLFSSLQ